MCPHLRLDEDYILYYTNLFRDISNRQKYCANFYVICIT